MISLLMFQDRGNVGNAKVAGLLKTINMTDVQYNTGVVSPASHFPATLTAHVQGVQ